VRHGYWFVESLLANAGFLWQPAESKAKEITIALFDRGLHQLHERQPWILDRVRTGQAVLALDVRGTGNLSPRAINYQAMEERYGTYFKLICDLFYLDDDLASGRIYDLLRAVELVRTDPGLALTGLPVNLFGQGQGGFYAYLAAAIEPAIKRCEVEDVFFSLDSLMRTRYYHDERLLQLLVYGMAERFDLPDLMPLFAGRDIAIVRPRNAQGRVLTGATR
jgi:hypothetical protein